MTVEIRQPGERPRIERDVSHWYRAHGKLIVIFESGSAMMFHVDSRIRRV